MKFEEFKELALNPQYPDTEKSVYRIDVHRFKHKQTFEEHPREFGVIRTESFMYPDLEIVERMIQRFVSKEYMNRQLYALYVYELPYNMDVSNDLYRRLWVYDRHGKLVTQSCCSTLTEDLNTSYIKFRGRDESFKPGELVEIYDRYNGSVRLGVVVKTPRTIKQCWEMRKIVEQTCIKEGVGAEFTDDNYWLYPNEDCYCVVYGPDFKHQHSFPMVTDVLPPSFHISANARDQFNAYYRLTTKYHQYDINAEQITEQTIYNRLSEIRDLINLF